MVRLDIRVHDALVVCECGVQGSFSGDVGRLQDKHCYRCQVIGRFIGTVLCGYFRNQVFWDYRDNLASARFEFLYNARMEFLEQSRINRACDIGETIRDGEADVRSRQLLMNAVSKILAAEVGSKSGTGETQELCLDLTLAAELLAKATSRLIRQRAQLRILELNEVLFDADAVKWLDPVEKSWTTGTLVEIRKSMVSVNTSESNNVRIDLPLMSVVRADSDD